MSEQVEVQVREGVWKTRDGRQVKVWRDTSNERRPWFGEHGGIRFSWMADGRYHAGTNSPADLVEHVGQLPEAQAEPAPEPQPVQVREGVWLTRDGEHVEVRARDMTGNESSEWRWHGRRKNYLATWRNDGTLSVSGEQSKGDLVQFLRPLPEPTPAPTPETEPQPMQVREGVWLTRDGREARVWVNCDPQTNSIWPWEGRVGDFEGTWKENGGYRRESVEHICDLVQYVGPLPEQTTTDTKRVEICEGVWRTRDGRQVHVRENTDWLPPSHPWVAEFDGEEYIWMRDGRYHAGADSPADLVEHVGQLPEAVATPEAQPVQVRPGIWKTREGHEVEVRERDDNGPAQFRWVGVACGVRESWRDDGTRSLRDESDRRDLVQYVGPLPQHTTTDTLAEIEAGMAEIESDVAELVQQDETCRLQAELVLVTSERETLRADLTEVASERDALVREINEATAARDSLEQQLATMQYERDLLAQQLVTKPSEEALQKEVSRKQIEINTLQDRLEHTTTDTLAEIEEQTCETLQEALGRALEQAYIADLKKAIDAVTADRDRLQQAHQTMTEHARELLESGQQARDQRDLLAQQLVTKPSEEALQKEVSRKQIEINTLQDRLEHMTTDRETLRRQFAAMTADRDRVQAELAIAIESFQNERFQAQTAHAGCKRAEEYLDEVTAQLTAMTADRDEQARLRETLDSTCRILGGEAKHWKNRAQEISDCMAVEITRAERAEAQVRELRIELDAEGETPANNRKAIAEGHLIGAQTGRQAAFEAVERWLEPLAGADSEHAAAVLQALPGCIRKLAELEGVTW